MRILVVEDDPMIGDVLVQQLTDAAYAVDWARDGTTAVGYTYTEEYSAILLDLGLPGRDGLEVLATIRRDSAVPVVVITARSEVDARIAGLDLGADDYLVKPFAFDELLARLRAVMRRGTDQTSATLSNGIIVLDQDTHEASAPDHPATALTRREFAVLRALLARPGTIRSRADLEAQVYGPDEQVESNAVEFVIHKLRSKLGADTIKNVRGVGWFVPRRG